MNLIYQFIFYEMRIEKDQERLHGARVAVLFKSLQLQMNSFLIKKTFLWNLREKKLNYYLFNCFLSFSWDRKNCFLLPFINLICTYLFLPLNSYFFLLITIIIVGLLYLTPLLRNCFRVLLILFFISNFQMCIFVDVVIIFIEAEEDTKPWQWFELRVRWKSVQRGKSG